ncbi:chemotaxis protein CheC [Camelliibacillus cellulosilyticus]|uniref:Chemotaxis protein CheC n=1 Tax=Camelliibacillus cellulosilyticus TaxID=2174486 RepID=A0ABV9GGG2_9BACL
MPERYQMDQRHLDVLKEIGNIGVGHAATSLSVLLNKKVMMKVPAVKRIRFTDWMDQELSDELAFAIYLRFDGDIQGQIFLLFSSDEAKHLLQGMGAPRPIHLERLTERSLEASAFGEIGNILAGAFLTALSDITGLKIYASLPEICVDMASAILAEGLFDFSLMGDEAVMMDAVITANHTEEQVQCAMTFLPTLGSFDHLMTALGISDG